MAGTVEAVVLEVMADARRGSFHLHMDCFFASDWTVVFGPSGAGKSTLLRLLAGLTPAQKARIVLDGSVLTDIGRRIHVRPGRRGIAMVSQQPALFPHLSVEENVGYGLAHLSRTERSHRVGQMLELAGAEELKTRRPSNLSGGEAQRVALARALATQPRLLLLD
jgi:molybdate transport system ATP-binding protein